MMPGLSYLHHSSYLVYASTRLDFRVWVQASVLLQGSAAAVEELAHEVLPFSLPSDPAVTM
jgi:hypothetical protein